MREPSDLFVGLASASIAVALTLASLQSSLSNRVNVIIAAIGAFFTLTATLLARSIRETRKLKSLFRALDHLDRAGDMRELLVDVADEVGAAVQKDISDFFRNRVREALSKPIKTIHEISNGRFKCLQEDEHQYVREALGWAEDVRAVASRGIRYWRDPASDPYFIAYTQAAARGATVTRIFLTRDEDEMAQVEEIAKRHSQERIRVYALDRGWVDKHLQYGFVLFSGKREMSQAQRIVHCNELPEGTPKSTVIFTDRADDVRRFEKAFKDIIDLARTKGRSFTSSYPGVVEDPPKLRTRHTYDRFAARASQLGVAVAGGGVVGLSTALLAAEAGCSVTVYAKSLGEIASTRAPASFKPQHVVYDGLVHDMLLRSRSRYDFVLTTYGTERSGVRRHVHWEASDSRQDVPRYLEAMEEVENFEAPEVPGGFRCGRRYKTFFVDTSVYMPWLREKLHERGVTFHAAQVASVEELAALQADVVFNCTGLGAREICGDTSVYPIKGQLAAVGPHPEMDWSISADGSYIYPRRNDTIVGGTVEHHEEDESTDAKKILEIMNKANRLVPGIDQERILWTSACMRPFRQDGIRLEREPGVDKVIIHNYGHGGAGVTLSWGSAEVALERAALAPSA